MMRNLEVDDIPGRFVRQRGAARRLNKSLPTDLEIESIPLEDLDRRVSDVDAELRAYFRELPMRELLGVDKALQRIQEEFANNVAKLGQLDHHITQENDKLETLKTGGGNYTEEHRKEVVDRLADLKEERETRLELASQNRKDLQSNVARIKQTIAKVLDSDTALGEKIKTLFGEQGTTIASILAAFGLVISTIVGFVTGGGGYMPSKPPSGGGGVQNGFKRS